MPYGFIYVAPFLVLDSAIYGPSVQNIYFLPLQFVCALSLSRYLPRISLSKILLIVYFIDFQCSQIFAST